jgi:rubrerythrin
MDEVQVLKIALKKEEGSINFYQDMLVKYPSLKDLLYSLLVEEQKHVKMIEKKIVEITQY